MRVYLDQNHWIYLTKGRVGHDASYQTAYRKLRELAISTTCTFPLSSIHYMETWVTQSGRQRRDVATTMLELARPPGYLRPRTIAGANKILRREIDSALCRRLGRQEPFPRYPIFSEGVGHAFGTRIEYRVPEGIDIPPKRRRAIEAYANWALETEALSGPHRDFPIRGLDTERYKAPSLRFQERELRLASEMTRLRPGRDERNRWIQGLCVIDILDEINSGLERWRMDITQVGASAEELTTFFGELPSRHVDYELQRLRHDNPQLPRRRTDLEDFAALCVAIPYCDVVVTEKVWTDLAKRAALDKQYQTTILRDVRDLPDAIGTKQNDCCATH